MSWKAVSTFMIDSSYKFRWQADNAIKKLEKINPKHKYYIMEKANPKSDDSDRYNVCYGREKIS